MNEHSCMMNMPPRVKYSDTRFLYLVWKESTAIRARAIAAHLIPEERWLLSVRLPLRSRENAGVPSEVYTTSMSSMYAGAVV